MDRAEGRRGFAADIITRCHQLQAIAHALPSEAGASATIGTDSLDAGDTVFIDNIRIGTSFADVVPVPEPASLLILGFGVVGLGVFLRRQARV